VKTDCLRMVELATLGWRRGGYWGSRPARPALGCSTMLDHHGGVWSNFF
jgi:hypothetical protein